MTTPKIKKKIKKNRLNHFEIKRVYRSFFDPSRLLDIHAVFTVTLQLPIESVPASLRGKPEASKPGDQG